MKKLLGLVVILLPGCAILDSGPAMMKATTEQVSIVFREALSQMDWTQITATGGARISDPRFAIHGYVATGVVYRMNLELIGADMNAGISGAGVGTAARNVEGNPPASD